MVKQGQKSVFPVRPWAYHRFKKMKERYRGEGCINSVLYFLDRVMVWSLLFWFVFCLPEIELMKKFLAKPISQCDLQSVFLAVSLAVLPTVACLIRIAYLYLREEIRKRDDVNTGTE